jgi:hypothetical protein
MLFEELDLELGISDFSPKPKTVLIDFLELEVLYKSKKPPKPSLVLTAGHSEPAPTSAPSTGCQ